MFAFACQTETLLQLGADQAHGVLFCAAEELFDRENDEAS